MHAGWVWDHRGRLTSSTHHPTTSPAPWMYIYKLGGAPALQNPPNLHQPSPAHDQSSGARPLGMLPGREADVRPQCALTSRWLPAAAALLLCLCCSVSRAHSTTVEHDVHIVHNVDNRSPEIDPFWYVGRGVRPIGRFGKRRSGVDAPDSSRMQPVVRTLELLLDSLRKEEELGEGLDGEDRGWIQ